MIFPGKKAVDCVGEEAQGQQPFEQIFIMEEGEANYEWRHYYPPQSDAIDDVIAELSYHEKDCVR